MKDGQGLEGLAHHEDLQQLGRVQRPYARTDVRFDDDETLAGELSKSLADGDSTCAALSGNSFLNNPLPGHKLTIEDLLSQGACDTRHRPESGRAHTQILGGHPAQDWIQTLAPDRRFVKRAKAFWASTR